MQYSQIAGPVRFSGITSTKTNQLWQFNLENGKEGQPLWAEINGRILGDVITFHAVYPLCRTIVTWIGQHIVENGIGPIHTHWLHATDIKEREEHEWMWYSNRIGADIFTRA